MGWIQLISNATGKVIKVVREPELKWEHEFLRIMLEKFDAKAIPIEALKE